jgi:exonuclease VII large subunit
MNGQIGQALLIAIVTAFATAVVGHWFGLRRLREAWKQEERERAAQWKREMRERMVSYKRQRLEETLGKLQEHVHHLIQAAATISTAPVIANREERLEKAAQDVLQLTASISTLALGVPDRQLHSAAEDFQNAQTEFTRFVANIVVGKEAYDNAADKELVRLIRKVMACGAALLRRCSGLPEEVYAKGITEE